LIDSSNAAGEVWIGGSQGKKLALCGGTSPTFFKGTFKGSATQVADLDYILPAAQPSTSIVAPTAGNFLYTTSAGVMSWVDPLGGTSLSDYFYLPGRASINGQTGYGATINTGHLSLISDSASVHAPEITLHAEGSMAGVIPMGGKIIIASGRLSNLGGASIDILAHDGNIGGSGGSINISAGAKGAGGSGNGYINLDGKGLIRPSNDNVDDFGASSYRLKDIYAAGTLYLDTSLSLLESVGATYRTTIAAGNQAANISYVLPTAQGGAGTSLQNDGSGNLSWAAGSGVATGIIEMYGGETAPTGYLLCDGTSYPVATYPALFAVIGYAFGGIAANFNVPDMRLNFPCGFYNGVRAIGVIGGAANNTPLFTGNAMGTHQHDAISAGTPAGSIDAHTSRTAPAGAGGAVFNAPLAHTFTGSAMLVHQHAAITAGTPAGSVSVVPTEPPYLTVNFIIKY
jgi:microcystin-dependent protein